MVSLTSISLSRAPIPDNSCRCSLLLITNLSISASWLCSILRHSTVQVNAHGAGRTIAGNETPRHPDSGGSLCAAVHSGPRFAARVPGPSQVRNLGRRGAFSDDGKPRPLQSCFGGLPGRDVTVRGAAPLLHWGYGNCNARRGLLLVPGSGCLLYTSDAADE